MQESPRLHQRDSTIEADLPVHPTVQLSHFLARGVGLGEQEVLGRLGRRIRRYDEQGLHEPEAVARNRPGLFPIGVTWAIAFGRHPDLPGLTRSGTYQQLFWSCGEAGHLKGGLGLRRGWRGPQTGEEQQNADSIQAAHRVASFIPSESSEVASIAPSGAEKSPGWLRQKAAQEAPPVRNQNTSPWRCRQNVSHPFKHSSVFSGVRPSRR